MNDSEPLISVIIPVYNVELYLARCLDSVLNNAYRNLEILCIDDGSSDRSAEILRAYAEKDSRIVPIFKKNGGVSSARNAGLDRLASEYGTFIDYEPAHLIPDRDAVHVCNTQLKELRRDLR